MSTRCQIAFFDSNIEKYTDLSRGYDALIYKHCDGYPSNMVPLIINFMRSNNRAGDAEYSAARFAHYLIQEQKDNGTDSGAGVGACVRIHGDIEYLYCIGRSEIVRVFSVSGWEKQEFKFLGGFNYKKDDPEKAAAYLSHVVN